MNIYAKMEKITPYFLTDYLSLCGVEDIDRYLEPDDSCFDNPFDYPNMGVAVNLFHKYIISKTNKPIGVVIDSDYDGCASASIMYMFIKLLNKTPIVFSHEGKQHGLNDLLEEISKSDCKLVVVPDAGTNNTKECQELKSIGKEVLVLDHHEIEKKNRYATIVNHHLGEGLNTDLSGAGVTYKFVQAYCSYYNIECPDYNDLVATSIISDVCNLSSLENRAFVYRGLTNPSNQFLSYLFLKKFKETTPTPHDIAWSISPLANALARMDEQETKLLFFDAIVGNIDYEKALTDINRVKRNQDNTVKQVVSDIEPTLDTNNKVIVGFTEAENKGFVGLIANKFAGKYNKPTILLRELNPTTYSGSLRSPVPLLPVINESKLGKCQGHNEACGITVKKSNLKKLISFLDTLELKADPLIEVAADITTNDINTTLCHACGNNKMLWGTGISEPTFHITLINPTMDVYRKKTNTVKLTSNGVSFIMFRATEEDIEALSNAHKVELIVTLEVNVWNDVESPQGMIVDYEVVGEENVEWNELF